jgi:hypothetical protein
MLCEEHKNRGQPRFSNHGFVSREILSGRLQDEPARRAYIFALWILDMFILTKLTLC